MKRILLVASVAACLVVFALRGSSQAQLQVNLQSSRLYGIYAAEVVSTQDLTQAGRLLVKVPSVSATAQVWALPSAPYVDGTVASIKLPPAGSLVWVEYQAGDPALPVWVGWRPR